MSKLWIILLSSILLACNNKGYKLLPKPVAGEPASIKMDSANAKFEAGADYYASGLEPVPWSVTLQYEKQILFEAKTGVNFRMPTPQPQKNDGNETFAYEDRLGKRTLIIYNEKCQKELASDKVEVIYKGVTYTGCGNYLYEPRLQGSWQIEKYNNAVAKGFANGFPTLQIDIPGATISGTDGCGSWLAIIMLQGDRMLVSKINFAKNDCNNSYREMLASKLSGKGVSYYIKEGKLWFYLEDDGLVTYSRKN